MARVIVVLVVIGVTIYATVDCLRSSESEVRGLPKPLWLLVILIGQPMVGAVAYLALGRQQTPGAPPPPRRGPRPVLGPDDDPDFLRSLDDDVRPKPNDGDADS